MWKEEIRAANQPIYGPDFKKELKRAQRFKQSFVLFDRLLATTFAAGRAGKASTKQAIYHFAFFISQYVEWVRISNAQ